ncbi:MAG: zinc metallopeptidase [Methanomicrobiales archaeon]|nr:zinc metallopeptidase [Methanomicrobiales archaeon]
MRWREGARKSTNVEDRRSLGPAAAGVGGIGLILILVLALATGMDPGALLQGTEFTTGPAQSQLTEDQQAALVDHVSLVLGDTEAVWGTIFREELGSTYVEPNLVLFTGSVDSACGYADSAVGPFYCPGDQKVYLDLDFFHDLQDQYGAPGDFAQAYVIAHEIGHHVQDLTGTLQAVDNARSRASPTEANRLSVALELQADCYAGLWANRATRQDLILEQGDMEEGLNAASAIGDDRLQKQSQGYVVPDSFTHGSSEQRVEWFRRGLETGSMEACNTFS